MINSLYFSRTPKTPEIILDPKQRVFEITGRSIPENSVEFYRPVMEWLDAYQKAPEGPLHLTVKLEYFNTSSSKCLIDLFRKLEKIHHHHAVQIRWFYEEQDEDMKEAGEDFQDILKVPVEMVVYISEDER